MFIIFFPFSTYGKEMSNINEILWVVKNVYLGGCHVQWMVEAHRPLVFHNKKKKSSVYGVREFHRESLYSS